jgi:ADP-dependent NAD(P)H-hydrate dehydratase / NAD(P)H-hydrate epimerase
VIALVDAAQMRALDAGTIARGLGAFTLMETAGRGVVAHLLAAIPQLRRAAVVCGSGGNGGDGFVVARVLADRGVAVTVYLAAPPPISSTAGQHRNLYEQGGGRVVDIGEPAQLVAARGELAGAEVVIDALFGVGLSRPVTGHLAQVIEAINQAPAQRCWAIDLPSGLDADRGRVMGSCVRAEATVSLGLHKLGAVTSPGFAHAGALHLVEIGLCRALVDELVASGATIGWIEERDARALVPPADPLAHKGSRGHALVIGGSHGMRGAAELASAAAMRAGAGLCTWAALGEPPSSQQPSLMTRGLGGFEPSPGQGGDDHGFDDEAAVREALARLDALVEGKALCVGPGLGRSAGAGRLVAHLIDRAHRLDAGSGAGPADGSGARSLATSLVLDADALFALAVHPTILPDSAVITPHPKEAARLLGLSTEDVEGDRVAAARALAARFGGVVVLKGSRTLICEGTRVWLCSAGSEALGTAGSGDVLAGTIAGLGAQGLSPRAAAVLAVWLHGRAGSFLGERLGRRGVLSSELPAQIGLELAALS